MVKDLNQFFEDHEDEFLKFDKVEEKLSSRPDINAFLLLNKLVPGNHDIVACAEHDQIWLATDIEELLEVAMPSELLDLYRSGVWYDDDNDSLSMFV